ncbi:hypothetical protein ILUMI_25512 [Ignelater luminosus]|uniref:Uncharacterized protein n=1 Tax=Ignelater luminosus TaxID=2038154 RepID=A0A8K0C5F6_IGNLU|nr:hypothetical protein ILUMI_25512 [Ignelater luminosus]
MQESKEKWLCAVCIKIKRKLRSGSDSTPIKSANFNVEGRSDIAISLFQITEQLKSISQTKTQLATSLNLCRDKMDEVNEQLKTQDKYLAECVKRIEDLETNNIALKK